MLDLIGLALNLTPIGGIVLALPPIQLCWDISVARLSVARLSAVQGYTFSRARIHIQQGKDTHSAV